MTELALTNLTSSPDASLGHALTAALRATFPLNLPIGIPEYQLVAQVVS